MVEPVDQEIKSCLTPVSRENLNEKIVSQIKNLILSKGIPVGRKLPPERELAQHFQVSRAVARQALKSLEQSGLVEIRTGARGGAFVAANRHMPLFRLSYDLFSTGELTLFHFYEARKTIECTTVCLAASKATGKEMERLYAINAKLADRETDSAKLGEYHAAFHVAVAEISGNPLLHVIVQSIMALLVTLYTGWSQVRTRKYMAEVYKRHEAILQAMKARDLERCRDLMAIDTKFTERLTVSRVETV